jgi:hypothetical protein
MQAFAGPAASQPHDRERVSIRIEHVQGDVAWRVTYSMSKPVDRLVFLREFGGRRHGRWKVETPDIAFNAVERGEALQSRTGKPFSKVAVSFASDTRRAFKDYPQNLRFTDGSEWIFTGHLYALPERIAGANKVHLEMELVPRSKERIVVGGRQHSAGHVRWTEDDPNDAGTFVYFGSINPVASSSVLAVVDPGLPEYLQRAFETNLPKLLGHYQEKTGIALARRPTVLIAYDPSDPGLGYGGDTLPGNISFNFVGAQWRNQDPRLMRDAFYLLAHEAAHLWNSDTFTSSNNSDAPWMHEGGAELFAWLAAWDLGIFDDHAFRGRIEDSLNGCIGFGGLVDKPLSDLFKERSFGLAYPCGALMNALVDLELKDKGGAHGFWRRLFKQAESTGNRYDLKQYFALLEQLSDRDEIDALLQTMWYGPVTNVGPAVIAQMRRQGVSVETGSPSPSLAEVYARQAMAMLMSADCQGELNFWTERDLFRVGGLPTCKALTAETTIITAIAGQSIRDNGIALYNAARSECGNTAYVKASTANDKVIKLPCPKESIPPVAPYWVVSEWPKAARDSSLRSE